MGRLPFVVSDQFHPREGWPGRAGPVERVASLADVSREPTTSPAP